ncbi:MAG: protein kinase [Deltaproteobacteria bacterium]|nr:protein kinase [Deltaproteobacteria bacterium]
MGGQTAEQIIAGVVLSERLAVTMYGAIHRAQWSGQRNLRGLVIDPKMLDEAAFRTALVDTKDIAQAISLDHPNIVPTVAVEHGGPDVVVVTRGLGRYVTLQDLISAARASRKDGGKLPLPVAAAIGKSVVEGLAAAHKAKVIHGAVHPRSVLLDQDGGVRLGDFVNGRALTTAVAQGADSSLWRGLSGYLASELVVGEDPSTASDVFGAGAMLFTMLSGEVPPGTLHVSPAVERLVQRALDTDLARRYKNANDLLENLLEAFEDDRWDLADRGEVIKAAGLSGTDDNIDDATEDLLASLGASAAKVQVTPMRPSVDLRAEAFASRQPKTGAGSSANRLDALLSDLDDPRELTSVEKLSDFKRDPISELIQKDPRRREAIVQVKPRVPSLDDPDDETPLPPPSSGRDSDSDLSDMRIAKRRSQSGDEAAALDAISGLGRASSSRPSNRMKGTGTDEVATLANLDAPSRMSGAADAAEIAAAKLEQAAKRAEAAAARVETNSEALQPVRNPKAIARPIVDPIIIDDAPAPRIKSRVPGIIGMLVIAGLIGGGVYLWKQQGEDAEARAADEKEKEAKRRKEIDDESAARKAAQPDSGTLKVKSNPAQAGVWLLLGKSPANTFSLSSGQMHEIRVDGVDGFQPIDAQVVAAHWSGEGSKRAANIVIDLKVAPKDAKGRPVPNKLRTTPPKPPDATGFVPGFGPLHVDVNCVDGAKKEPCKADVWLYIGMTDNVEFPCTAGRGYEVRLLKEDYEPGKITVGIDEWRDPKKGSPGDAIDSAAKLTVIERSVDLLPKKKGP